MDFDQFLEFFGTKFCHWMNSLNHNTFDMSLSFPSKLLMPHVIFIEVTNDIDVDCHCVPYNEMLILRLINLFF